MKPYQVAIAGGGLLGRLTAWRLAEQGIRTVLYDAGSPTGENSAAYVAAAMLAPAAEAVDGAPEVIALGYSSLKLWRQYLKRINSPVFFQENGSLIVWHNQDAALKNRFLQHLERAHNGMQPAQQWSADDIARNEPQLGGRFSQGLFLPEEGQLDNRQTIAALAEAAQQAGVDCRWHAPVDNLDELHAQADWVIDCRGIGARQAWNQSGGTRLRGIRGEVARVIAPEVKLNRPVRLLHPRYPLYVCPKENGLYVIGATQIDSEDDSPVSVRSSLELFSALYAVHPAFGEGRVLETNVGLRPTLVHDRPEIRCHAEKQLIEANGLFRHGFMISPSVAEAVVETVSGVLGGNRPETAGELPVLYCGN
ncbi:glycine oxidase ThiO [Neisseria zalophi]|uniref:D-amino-acid oxidase n=1 Tax=Neisseria zalophi TaxID=640030 RepID=A0A5J6PRW3_9NEIS|nr:glycine oxidase ThiO [Neisseria zalophi]QEY25508.1 glycine oxidase ThiO [Neisseria zalophi]